jgi:hypothetical protein
VVEAEELGDDWRRGSTGRGGGAEGVKEKGSLVGGREAWEVEGKREERTSELKRDWGIVLKTKPVWWFNQKKPEPKASPVF